MQVPIIDFDTSAEGDSQRNIQRAIDQALAETGFMSVKNLSVDQRLLHEVYAASKAFFNGPDETKRRCAYLSASENFGYQGLAEENLNPQAPADLKETFTMRNILHRPVDDSRWPAKEFRELMCAFYANLLEAGYTLQRTLANTLGLDEDFFVRCHSGENVTLRLLYYPATGVDHIAPGQMGAGAHTDYGLLTMLFQDQVGGLQVLDKQQQWQDVDPIEQAIVINSGDLLERWTNGRYTLTLHCVVPKIGDRDRLSVVMFLDPDSSTQVSALESCVDEANPPRQLPITAGEHLQQKLDASHKDRY
jgi:isopenicillin N synthase-like dioxygenase